MRLVEAEEERLLTEANSLLDKVREAASGRVASTRDAARVLALLREAVYEDMNQLQHEALILDAVRWLRQHVMSGAHMEWLWNPRQRGGKDEPDLMCRSGERVVVAEVTASKAPVGVLDSRMRWTLEKLADMKGERYYFVRTQSMKRRAETKVAKGAWAIQVVQLP
jgi:hypothetical protein